jgi:hypothetical protein
LGVRLVSITKMWRYTGKLARVKVIAICCFLFDKVLEAKSYPAGFVCPLTQTNPVGNFFRRKRGIATAIYLLRKARVSRLPTALRTSCCNICALAAYAEAQINNS